MEIMNLKILSSTILILLISSTKCCIYSTNLAELGKILLGNLQQIKFTDYKAVEDFRTSINFALQSSLLATPETIQEITSLTKINQREVNISNATEMIENYFNDVFSLLTPYDNYNVEDLQIVVQKHKISHVMKNSLALLRALFEKPLNTRRIIKTLHAQSQEYHCQSTLSLHQKILGLHNRALLNLIMGFSTIIYLSKQNHVDEQDFKMSPEEMTRFITNMYDQHTAQAMNKINRALQGVSRYIQRCDPQEHEHEKTYDRLYDFLEYYLTSERFLSENHVCNATSKHYNGVKHVPEVHQYIDESIKCFGTLYQCEPVDLKHLYLYGNDKIYRRYHAFSVANLQSPDDEILYGNIGDATFAYTKDDLNGVGKNSPNHTNLNENSTVVVDATNCPIYGCYCDNHDSPRTVRYFSTKLVASTSKYDRVITGLRLRVQDRVVYIQIQTGKLRGFGVVDPATVFWKEIQPVDISIDKNSPNAEYIELNYHNRSLYMDDVIAPKGTYLTGVKFTEAKNGVRIAGKFTPYNDLTLATHFQAVMLTNNDQNRTEIKLENSSIPLYMMGMKNEIMSTQGRDYIKFQSSDLRNDAGQTTVPFLDIQSVQTVPPAALGGFGIYLRGRPGLGSFIALTLISPKF